MGWAVRSPPIKKIPDPYKMTEKVAANCPSCGARLDKSPNKCYLCGWEIGMKDYDLRVLDNEVNLKGDATEAVASFISGMEPVGVFCHNCGHKNLAGANFCSACGTKLQKVEPVPEGTKKAEPPPELKKPVEKEEIDPPAEAEADVEVDSKTSGSQVAMLIVAGFMIVAALYMITAFSKRAFPTSEATPPAQAEASSSSQSSGGAAATGAAPLAADVEARIAELTSEAESLDGDAQIAKKREIIGILMGVQRFDRAAPVQMEIAEASNTAQDWFQAGHFYSDWMERLNGADRANTAQNAVAAYEKGLEITDDLNVRTALAMAYLNTSTPMLGITQIRQVLDEEPDHLQGNFYFGVMLMQINRVEQAKERFERVMELTSTDDPMHQQADLMLRNINSVTQ